jgi:superfamily II DNA or RNA helicase
MKSLVAGEWQNEAIAGISKHLNHRAGRAALLQLPTGFGKSLVAVRIFKRLKRIKPTLQLAIVLPKQQIPDGWKDALLDGLAIDRALLDRPFVDIRTDESLGVLFCTKRDISRVLLKQRGRKNALARRLTSRPHLIVLDEVHRYNAAGGIMELMHEIYRNTERWGKVEAEKRLSSSFRSPTRGRRKWPKWLLLSATPINPVSLDRVDPLDVGRGSETIEGASNEEADVDILISAAERLYAVLCQLDGQAASTWFDDHISAVRRALLGFREFGRNGVRDRRTKQEAPIELPTQLPIFPSQLPKVTRSRPRTQIDRPTVSGQRIEQSIKQVVLTAKAIARLTKSQQARWAMAERIVLSGGFVKVEDNSIEDEPYSAPLARSVAQIVETLRSRRYSSSEKIESLLEYVKGTKEEHILIFCTHRAVARSVVRHLKLVIKGDRVRLGRGTGEGSDRIRAWFNDPKSHEVRILVATDAWSESIDLHERANILVHYELPWSPLRVLQRVGRLWRLRKAEIEAGSKPEKPRLPAVLHFAHPGSIDEEILWRLRRRWGYLRVLALQLRFLLTSESMGHHDSEDHGWREHRSRRRLRFGHRRYGM